MTPTIWDISLSDRGSGRDRSKLVAAVELLVQETDSFLEGQSVRALAVDYQLLPISLSDAGHQSKDHPLEARLQKGDRLTAILSLTDLQRLLKIELPLAAPFILAGLRTATVTCIGIATIAAAVGAGGLGELIFRGVASVDNRLVLAGAVPAALLALAADGTLGLLERLLRLPAPEAAGQ